MTQTDLIAEACSFVHSAAVAAKKDQPKSAHLVLTQLRQLLINELDGSAPADATDPPGPPPF